jgi:hypothetical protein
MRRGFWVFATLDCGLDLFEDFESDGSFVSSAALVHTDSEVCAADEYAFRFCFAGGDEFERHGGTNS